MPSAGVQHPPRPGRKTPSSAAPPFVDAMTSGFLVPLICDLRFENGEIIWDNDLHAGGSGEFCTLHDWIS